MTIGFVTQTVDPDDQVLGFVTQWIQALCERFSGVVVIANQVAGPQPDLGPGIDVISLGKERGAGRWARGAAYQAALLRMVSMHPQAILAHMSPVYLNLAAPLAKAVRVPLLLWFAHPADTRALRVAERLADRILTSLPGAYPRPGPKVRAIGQGIDLRAFAMLPQRAPDGALRLLALGRTSPAKGFDVVIRAVGLARKSGMNVKVRVVGPSTTVEERRHRIELQHLTESLDLDESVSVETGVPPSQVTGLLAQADALVNAMVAGSGDKVVFEAMASGRPVIASNPVLNPLLEGLPVELRFQQGSAEGLAGRITDLGRFDPSRRPQLAEALRRRIEGAHSLEHWGGEVARVVAEVWNERATSR
jgi:glycosyltransferase involved in cell wall biosynthesis